MREGVTPRRGRVRNRTVRGGAEGQDVEVRSGATTWRSPRPPAPKPARIRSESSKSIQRSSEGGSAKASRAPALEEWHVAEALNRYAVGRTLGKGTFGKVKKGFHKLTGIPVAVKILEKARIMEVADMERVEREIYILKRLNHPNVIRLYEVIDTPLHIYLIMEYCGGGELYNRIVSAKIEEAEAAHIFHQIINGVDFFHKRNVVHRDLKPENMLLDDDGTLKVVDFGLGNVFQTGRLLQTACGSPCYAAPEMIAGEDYDGPTADIWSLGVVLYALLSGYLPFEDPSTAKLYDKIMSGSYEMPSGLSPAAQDMLRRLLTTDPSRRITAEGIRQHSWYVQASCPTDPVSPKGDLPSGEKETVFVQQDIIDHMFKLGFVRDEVLDSLRYNKHNRDTATYVFLEEFKRRKKKEIQETKSRQGRVSPPGAASPSGDGTPARTNASTGNSDSAIPAVDGVAARPVQDIAAGCEGSAATWEGDAKRVVENDADCRAAASTQEASVAAALPVVEMVLLDGPCHSAAPPTQISIPPLPVHLAQNQEHSTEGAVETTRRSSRAEWIGTPTPVPRTQAPIEAGGSESRHGRRRRSSGRGRHEFSQLRVAAAKSTACPERRPFPGGLTPRFTAHSTATTPRAAKPPQTLRLFSRTVRMVTKAQDSKVAPRKQSAGGARHLRVVGLTNNGMDGTVSVAGAGLNAGAISASPAAQRPRTPAAPAAPKSARRRSHPHRRVSEFSAPSSSHHQQRGRSRKAGALTARRDASLAVPSSPQALSIEGGRSLPRSASDTQAKAAVSSPAAHVRPLELFANAPVPVIGAAVPAQSQGAARQPSSGRRWFGPASARRQRQKWGQPSSPRPPPIVALADPLKRMQPKSAV